MKRCLALFAALVAAAPAAAQSQPAAPSVEGRWDLTFDVPGQHRAGWLEVRHSGSRTLVGQFVGPSGSARPIAKVEQAGGEMRFTIPPQWERNPADISFTARLEGDSLRGTMVTGEGQRVTWHGVRAPSLRRTGGPRWGTPVRLIQPGLAGWRVIGGASEWEVTDGVLRNRKSGGNLATEQSYQDFRLHAEFRYPEGSNSGLYLRGRYEVQIADSREREPTIDMLGSVYGFLAPSEVAVRGPGEWQSFDITLVGRTVTVVLNGKTIICEREIPGITGGALDSDEAAPGPLLIQGDHGPVEFRNLTITPAL